uniref:Putative secreted peptide n=1 Tax=Anopheles braziliensis TaxID=58242 RepID=A0A2M3ZX08_9DIPT
MIKYCVSFIALILLQTDLPHPNSVSRPAASTGAAPFRAASSYRAPISISSAIASTSCPLRAASPAPR